ncbi:MAG: hypothetical protein QXD43_02870 [Candidatus Aenigmatarchaeota archaeon]
MALDALRELITNNLDFKKYERISNNKITGIFELRRKEVEIPNLENAVLEYIEAGYLLPKLTKSNKAEIERVCEEIDCVYSINKIKDKELRKKGLHVEIKFPISAISEREIFDNLRKFNIILGFPDYEL